MGSSGDSSPTDAPGSAPRVAAGDGEIPQAGAVDVVTGTNAERSDTVRAEPFQPVVTIRPATPGDFLLVRGVLDEAARWLHGRGDEMWGEEDLAADRIRREIDQGQFHLAEVEGEPAGTFRYQLTDPEFWPDLGPAADSAFLHRLAVRRRFSGGGVSSAILTWAAARTASIGREWLRLDCDTHRLRLREVYERFGFVRRDERQVGPFLVTRYELPVSRRG